MNRIEFRGRSEKDVQQQKREFNWLMKNISKAVDKGDREKEEKYRKKLDNWLKAHPYTKESYDSVCEKVAVRLAEENPERLISEMKRRGIELKIRM